MNKKLDETITENQGEKETLEVISDYFMKIVALCFSVIVISYLLGFIPPHLWSFQTMCLICLFILGFGPNITEGIIKKKVLPVLWNVFVLGLGLSSCIYLFFEIPRLQRYYGSVWTIWDIVFGVFMIVVIIELSRQKFGLALPTIAFAGILYVLFGDILPIEFFGHTGFSFGRLFSYLFGPAGVFGIVLSVFVKIIFLYMLFGTFLINAGIAKVMVDFAFAAAGRFRGGPAKVSVISSAILGMVNGNSVANVATTGSVTIPLMKETGYRPKFAGAIEAAASTGGQILPPVMGAGAFIMAELLSIPYQEVLFAAMIPAILYFAALLSMVDLEAVKQNIKGIKVEETVWKVLKRGFFLVIPVFILIYQLVIAKATVSDAAITCIVACIIVSWFNKDKGERLGPKKTVGTLIEGAQGTVGIGAMCAVAGIVIATISMTGIGNRFGSVMVNLVGDNTLIVAIITALVALILGIGLSTTAAYIISVSVAAPALISIGVDPLATHLFVFYFAVASAITPPVGAAFYVGAAIAKAPPMATGFLAFRLGIAALIVPFFFINNTFLLMDGSVGRILIAVFTALLGIAAISMAAQGNTFYYTKLNWVKRILLVASFGLLINGSLITDLYGFGLIVLVLLLDQKFLKKVFGKRLSIQNKNININ